MRIAIPGLTFLTAALVAAAPAPKPVITIEGVTTAVKLDAKSRQAIIKSVEGLNASLVKVIALHAEYDAAAPAQRGKLGQEIGAVHEQCLAWHESIAKTLTPEQLKAFYTYAHAQMAEARIDHQQIHLLMPKGASDHHVPHADPHGG